MDKAASTTKVQVRTLKRKAGWQQVQAICESAGECAVENQRGDVLARITLESSYKHDPTKPAGVVPASVFRDWPALYLHGATLGHTFKLEEPGGLFIVLPPTSYRNNVSPMSLGFWWVLRHEPYPSETLTIDLSSTLRDHERTFGWIGARLDALESRKLRPKSSATTAEPSPAPEKPKPKAKPDQA